MRTLETTVKFVYKGLRVKFKFTGTKKVEYSYTWSYTSVAHNSGSVKIEPRGLRVAWGFRIWRIEWCDRHRKVTTPN